MSQTENTPNDSQIPEPPQPDPALKRRSRVALWKYGAARVVLFIVLTVAIQLLAMAVGVAIPDADGRPIAAIHIAASLSEWAPEDFRRRVAPLAAEAVRSILSN